MILSFTSQDQKNTWYWTGKDMGLVWSKVKEEGKQFDKIGTLYSEAKKVFGYDLRRHKGYWVAQ